jgi:hypothetical protein
MTASLRLCWRLWLCGCSRGRPLTTEPQRAQRRTEKALGDLQDDLAEVFARSHEPMRFCQKKLAGAFLFCDGNQFVDIRQIFLPARGTLVSEELFKAENRHGLTVDHRVGARLPRGVEIYIGDRRENIDAVWRLAELHHASWFNQIRFRDAEVAETEVAERAENSVRVRRCRSDQEVDITGESRIAVKRHGVSTDEEIFNVMRVQQSDELFQIGLQLRQELSGAALPVPAECRAVPQVTDRHKTDRRLDRHLRNL